MFLPLLLLGLVFYTALMDKFTEEITQSFTVTGYVKKLPTDSLDFYYEALDYYSLSAAEREIILPLYLAPADFDLNVIALIISLVCIAAALLLGSLFSYYCMFAAVAVEFIAAVYYTFQLN